MLGEYFRFRPIRFCRNIFWFLGDLLLFCKKRVTRDAVFVLQPMLEDRSEFTPVDPVYFYQDAWAARHIFRMRPSRHVDVGSSAKTIGILSQFVPLTMVDIRPLPVTLKNLTFLKGSILKLPFQDGDVESISSLCVVEHIGLGRYGDTIDPLGTCKGIKELMRVTKKGGTILFSVPVNSENTVHFNAHRSFTRNQIIEMFDLCRLKEEQYIYELTMCDSYQPDKGFGTGLFLFKKK